MLYQYFKKISILGLLFISLAIFSLFIKVSPTLAWAEITVCVSYNGQPLNRVLVTDHTSGNQGVTGSNGDGCVKFTGLDCGQQDESKRYISIDGFQDGSPPAGIPAGGTFNPQTFALDGFGNGQVLPATYTTYTPPGPSATPTPSPVACGGPCNTSSECDKSCPICANNTCVAPTPTKVPCGGPCTSNAQCDIQCPVCGANNTCVVQCGGPCTSDAQCDKQCPICANNTCVAPTPTKVPCGGPCTSNAQCDIQCPICANNTCVAPTPTPTPTPSCNCDGVIVQGLFYSGTKVDATGYAKVMNPDTNKAEVLSMKFTLYKDNVEIANSGEIKVGSPERKTDSSGVPIDRYNSKWSFTIHDPGSYKLLEDIYCGWKSSQVLQPQTRVVLGTSTTQKKSIFSLLADWLSGIFRPKSNLSQNVALQGVGPTSTPTIPATPTPTPFNPETAKSLKLKTVSPNVTTQCKEATFDVPL